VARHRVIGQLLLRGMEVALDYRALTPDVARALAAVRTARDALQPDDPRRVAVQDFLVECTRRHSQPDALGDRPQMPARRREFVGRVASDPRWDSREAAYSAMEALIEAGWPPLTNAEQLARARKRRKVAASFMASSGGGRVERPDERLEVEMAAASAAAQRGEEPPRRLTCAHMCDAM